MRISSPSRKTSARKPSHLGSKIQLPSSGSSPIRLASIGKMGGFTGRFTLPVIPRCPGHKSCENVKETFTGCALTRNVVRRNHLRKRLIAVIAILFGCMGNLQGHALLKGVTPQAGSTVDGREVTFALDFNTRIDGVRSRLELLTPEKKTIVLQIEPQL